MRGDFALFYDEEAIMIGKHLICCLHSLAIFHEMFS